ncbi:MAG: MarR family transcriptional regulator [Asticcacaulis sp.]|uniref:MarR family winged helix-turn-helix transcriptional regulator n=1 Tax=Asticcacaulis sp. TaxID=1872648 RepID=UPI0039E480E1
MSAEYERFSYALHNAARMWRLALDRRLKDLGISQAGWLSIAYIAKASGPISQSELAALVQVEAATMVSTIDRLEKTGLVRRVTSETDRRVKHLVLTVEGEAIYAQVKARADDMRRDILSGLDATKMVVATEILEDLQKLIENS